jgi:UDP-N-acetylglucosamine 2-epimerase (non-hydrolysing)
MNEVFFEELGLPKPDVYLGVGSGTHGEQTARIMERYEKHLDVSRPQLTVVFGDVNSTLACALAAVKLRVPVVHLESGLRSYDRSMPEEINRLLTDTISDLLLVSEPSGVDNLRKEGIDGRKIRLVGNVMIDTLMAELPYVRANGILSRMKLPPEGYGLITMHRPNNVDDPSVLERLLNLFRHLSCDLPLVFPVHPRTRKAAEQFGLQKLLEPSERFQPIPPVSYRENLALMDGARVVMTDSGGMQEETSILGVPCLTLRDNTERPITTELGTSRLVGNDPERIRSAFGQVLAGRWPTGKPIPLWDGKAGERAASAILEWFENTPEKV